METTLVLDIPFTVAASVLEAIPRPKENIMLVKIKIDTTFFIECYYNIMSFIAAISLIFNSTLILKTLGVAGLLAIIFAESGLFFGFFLPGDSLIFTAGLLASQGIIPFWITLPGVIIAAILGDSVGYAFGKKIGHKIFTKEDSWFFNKKYAERAATFFEEKGGQSIVLARFIPIIRTFTPIMAGVGQMEYKKFIMYNSLGGFLWAGGALTLGYFLGNTIPNIDHYILPIVIIIIIVSFIPGLREILKSR